MRKDILIIIIILFGCLYVWAGIYLPKEPNPTQEISFLVEKDQGAKEISTNLKEQNLIRGNLFFRFYVLARGISGELKAGEYSLSRTMNIPEIVNKFVSGDVIKKKITIIEGWNLRDIGRYFEDKGIARAEELDPNLEGYLFPDTYEIFPKDEIEEIIEKILANFEKKLTSELRKEIDSQDKTIFEIVTMASLIEKEVKTLEDKKVVSGILWKRLSQGIPLQVDATIIYITDKETTKVSKSDLQIDSPYNTYKYRGLPLGPICNPGMESILAAIYPKKSQYFYYLSSPEGKTIFSETLEKHNIAKARYLN